MPKISKHGGASYRGDFTAPAPEPKPIETAVEPVNLVPAPDGSLTLIGDPDAEPDFTVTAAAVFDEGGEEPSPGSSSSTSSETPETKSGNSSTRNPSRARTAANRSKTAPKGSSSAPSTAGPTSSN